MIERGYLEKTNIKKAFLKDTDFSKSSCYYLDSNGEVTLLKKSF